MGKIKQFRRNQLSDKEAQYWSNVAILCGQVFFGIFAVTLFAAKFDLYNILVLSVSLIFAIICWIIGSRLNK